MDESGFSLLLPKALPSESPRTRNFPSLTDDKAYMTTKRANSKVMKSAYEINHRS